MLKKTATSLSPVYILTYVSLRSILILSHLCPSLPSSPLSYIFSAWMLCALRYFYTALPLSFDLVKGINYEAPHCIIFSIFLLLVFYIQIYVLTVCSHMPSTNIDCRIQNKFRVAGTWNVGRATRAFWKNRSAVSEGSSSSATLCQHIYMLCNFSFLGSLTSCIETVTFTLKTAIPMWPNLRSQSLHIRHMNWKPKENNMYVCYLKSESLDLYDELKGI
jgi:hypothetical protein